MGPIFEVTSSTDQKLVIGIKVNHYQSKKEKPGNKCKINKMNKNKIKARETPSWL